MRTTARSCAFTTPGPLLAAFAGTLLMATSASPQNVSDATAPSITQISFATTTVNTTSGAQNVTVTVTATDDLSGVNYMYVYLRTTATTQPNNSSSISCYVSSLSSGSRTNGTFIGTCTFPQYSRSGQWFAYQTYANDLVGNYQSVSGSNGTQLSIAPQVIAVTAPDQPIIPPTTSTPPEIVSLTVSPTSVNTIGAAATLTIEARVTATGSPFYYGYAYLVDPTSSQTIAIYFYSWDRISGDAADGVYRRTTSLPPYSRGGAWVWNQALVYNQMFHYNYYATPENGRFRYRYTYNGANTTYTDLYTSGPSFAPSTLSVDSIADTAAPTLVNFELTPSSIDVSTSSKTVTMTLAAADDLSGFSYGCAYFVSPNGQQNRGNCVSSPNTTAAIFFPQYSQAGNWALYYMYVVDRRGNTRYLYSNELQALGFPAGLQISSGVEVQNVTGYVDATVTLTAKLTKLGAPAPGKTLSFTLRGTPVGSATTDSSGIATLSNVSTAGIAVGTHVNVIVASFAGDAEQAAASGQATLIVTNKQNQTISFAPLADRSLSASPFVVSATASSGLTVTFAASGSCTVSGNSVTLTGTGSCTIVASQAGNAVFNPAPSVSRTFSVLQKSDQTITFAAIADRSYGDATFTVAPTSSSGLTVTLTAAGNCSANGFTITVGNVGNCSLTASQAGNADYNGAPNVVRSFAINPASLTVTADANPATAQADGFTKVYNGQAFTGFTVRYTGFVNGDGAGALGGALTLSGAGVTATSAGGPYSVTPGGLTATNYAISFVSGTLTISPAPLTITANDASKLLNAPLPSFGVSFSGFVNSETDAVLGGALSCTTAATASSPVGTYPIACSGLTSPNYAIQFNSGTLFIRYAGVGTTCQGDLGHTILEPVNSDGTSVFKQGSSVPAKFRVCDAAGVSIGDANVVRSFTLVQTIAGTASNVVSEDVISTTPTSAFRWDATAQQWIFNISTKSSAARQTYVFEVLLNDGTSIQFRFGLR